MLSLCIRETSCLVVFLDSREVLESCRKAKAAQLPPSPFFEKVGGTIVGIYFALST